MLIYLASKQSAKPKAVAIHNYHQLILMDNC